MDSTFPPQNILATSYTLKLCRVTFLIFTRLVYRFSLDFVLIRSPPNIPPPASPPRSVVLDCHHVSVIDYSVINEFRDLLRQFKLREVQLVFARLQVRPSTITVSQTFIVELLITVKLFSPRIEFPYFLFSVGDL